MKQSRKILVALSLTLLLAAMPGAALTEWGNYNDESWSTKERPCERCKMKKFSPQTTQVGKKMAIRGYGFGKEPGEVIFSENVKAEIVSWSPRRIWVVVPEGAVSGSVRVVKECPSGRFEVSQPIKIGDVPPTE